MELWNDFDRLCRQDPPPIDLLSRIWEYMNWSIAHEDDAVNEAAILYFLERIEDTRRYREVLPMFMSREEYEHASGLREPKEGK